jgi:putative oxidoreductase
MQSTVSVPSDPRFTRAVAITHDLLRIVAGLLFVQHGLQKMLGMLGGYRGTPGATAPLLSQSGLAGGLELVGGLLLVIGLFTRPVAFVLSGLMAVAYFMSHAPDGFWPLLNRGELAVLYSFVFLMFAATGAGPWSVDAMLRRRGVSRR